MEFPSGALAIDPSKVRDIAPRVLDEQGRMRVLPAGFWHTTTRQERALFGHRHGVYSFPTIELVEHLQTIIGDRKAIEIGAGHGVLAEALGITATDSLQQNRPEVRLYYALTGQPTVPYGPCVIECDASQAMRMFEPRVVIGCWVTQKWHESRPDVGNAHGIDEDDVIDNCETYVLIGNEGVHREKPIWRRPHTIEYPPYVYSRAHNGDRDFIAVWQGSKID